MLNVKYVNEIITVSTPLRVFGFPSCPIFLPARPLECPPDRPACPICPPGRPPARYDHAPARLPLFVLERGDYNFLHRFSCFLRTWRCHLGGRRSGSQCPKFANLPPKHRNINNEMFYGRGNSCFRTRPKTRCGQPKYRIKNPWAQGYKVQGSSVRNLRIGRQSTETSIMRCFMVVGIAVFGPAPKTRCGQPKNQIQNPWAQMYNGPTVQSPRVLVPKCPKSKVQVDT
jgi:hypothetical protein